MSIVIGPTSKLREIYGHLGQCIRYKTLIMTVQCRGKAHVTTELSVEACSLSSVSQASDKQKDRCL
jgi:hypothetical protein